MKKYLILLFVIIAGAIFFGFGFHTYFIDDEVNEEMPEVLVTESAIISGQFNEIDLIHKGSGTAKLIKDGESTILRFEDFEVTNGPDLFVYLTKSETPTGDVESLGDYIDLGRLKGNIGNQNYSIDQNIEGYDTVVIWCKKYEVLFSFANLK